MKRVNRGVIGLLLAPVIFTAAFTSASCSISAYANDEQNIMDEYKADSYDVCFYIRGAAVGAEIPSEPYNRFGELYSSPIRINSAVTDERLSFSDHEVDGSEDSLLSDNFTASNSVSEMLSAIPDADSIKAVVPEFDENKHYVVWYVMKAALSTYPNWDVVLHVDGVIRERANAGQEEPGTEQPSTEEPGTEEPGTKEPGTEPENPGTEQPAVEPENPGTEQPGTEQPSIEEPATEPVTEPDKPVADPEKPSDDKPAAEGSFTPEEIKALDELGRDVEIRIEALYLDENGNEVKSIPYDGQEHLIGGFSINVVDKADHSLIDQLRYNYKGELISYAADDCTYFKVRDRVFSTNVTGAYARAKELGEAIISFYSGSTKLDGPQDISVSDEKGRSITSYLNIIPMSGSVKVEKRDLTLEAGSCVRNDNGKTLTDDSYKITSGTLLEGHSIDHVVFNGSQTGAGESKNEITSVTIVDENGKDVTALYNIETVDGKLVLVDAGRNKSSEEVLSQMGSSQSGSASSGTSYSSVPSVQDSYQTVKVILEDGKATYVKVPYEFGAANDTEDTPVVLGARKSATGDNNNASTEVVMILFGIVTLVATISGLRKSKAEKADTESNDAKKAA